VGDRRAPGGSEEPGMGLRRPRARPTARRTDLADKAPGGRVGRLPAPARETPFHVGLSSVRVAVWNHRHRRLARFWSADHGTHTDVLDLLRERKPDRLSIIDAPTDDLVQQLLEELSASRHHLRRILDGYWEPDWRRDHKRFDESPEDHLWRAAQAVSEIEQALSELDSRGVAATNSAIAPFRRLRCRAIERDGLRSAGAVSLIIPCRSARFGPDDARWTRAISDGDDDQPPARVRARRRCDSRRLPPMSRSEPLACVDAGDECRSVPSSELYASRHQ
jgi:hypothetical protein